MVCAIREVDDGQCRRGKHQSSTAARDSPVGASDGESLSGPAFSPLVACLTIQGHQASQPVLGVGAWVREDPDHTDFEGARAWGLPIFPSVRIPHASTSICPAATAGGISDCGGISPRELVQSSVGSTTAHSNGILTGVVHVSGVTRDTRYDGRECRGRPWCHGAVQEMEVVPSEGSRAAGKLYRGW